MEGFVTAVVNSTACSIVLIIFLISIYFVIKGEITFALMVAVTQLSGNITNPVFNIIDSVNKVKSVKNINKKLVNIISSNCMDDTGVDIEKLKVEAFIKCVP